MADVKDFGFDEEWGEEVLHKFYPTNYPQPNRRWRLVYEVANQSVEELYYIVIDLLREEFGFMHFDKIIDVFAASEQSAFFGTAQQRLGLQQDKVSQFLATIGKMVKELFQLVREIRILDERLEIYQASYNGEMPAEISLKGYWIDLVEGGAKNPASVYGMAREIGFVTLPDLFFSAPIMQPGEIQSYLNNLEFNRKVKEVLSRKLYTFCVWKKQTYKEMNNRRTFTVKYLRQHYDVIKMYMMWVKPYLRNIARLNMDQTKMSSAQLISAFEGSMVEIEILAKRPFGERPDGKPGAYAIYDLHFDYRSRPELKYQQEGYQRGPIHVGQTIFTLREYAWTPEEVEKYKEFKVKEDFDLLATIDSSVEAAYTALGEDLEKYLKEAGEQFVGEKRSGPMEKSKREGLFDPFLAPFRSASGEKSKEKPIKAPSKADKLMVEDATKDAAKYCDKKHYSFCKRVKACYGFVY